MSWDCSAVPGPLELTEGTAFVVDSFFPITFDFPATGAKRVLAEFIQG